MDEQIKFSKRESQIMDAIYSRGEATATEVLKAITDPPSRTAVRTILRILVDKGHLKTRKHGRELVYSPVKARKSVGQSAFRRVIQTFFGGSLEGALAAHLADRKTDMSDEELNRLVGLIREARRKEER